jgi:hypothetical protein
MYKVRLTKVSSSHNYVRDDVIEGECEKLPHKGFCFTLFAKPKVKVRMDGGENNTRVIFTTPIVSISEMLTMNGIVFEFETINSKYKLEVLE